MIDASPENISRFLEGHDPQKYIVGIEAGYNEKFVHLIIQDPEKGKYIEKHRYTPFVWSKTPNMDVFYGGDRRKLKSKMREYGIKFIPLKTKVDDTDADVDRMENGYKFLVTSRGTYRDIIQFYREGGLDIYGDPTVMSITPTEQFFIQTGKRLFKGLEDYDDVHRMVFDIETHGLDPATSRIFAIGISDNRGFNKIITMRDNDESERNGIIAFFQIIDGLKPTIIAGYNSENFDWHFIIERLSICGVDVKRVAKTLSKIPLYRKKATLKLAAEIEQYQQTVMWGYNIMDTIHAVRRAMAINSNIKAAGLKYITKYSNANKDNRVYIDGDQIGPMWNDELYWFNTKNGQWGKWEHKYAIEEDTIKVKGSYIVKRYLKDDLWETMKVDTIYNQATFLTAKILPTTFQRAATMGTAAIWKVLMMGWSYENGLAVPEFQKKEPFTGGLSRLLEVGYARDIVKLDFASLYPSIQLTHDVFPDVDISGAMKGMLRYVYDQRNKYKAMKNDAAKRGDKEMAGFYDKKQLPLKIINNSMFGSVSAPNVFPWGEMKSGEMITCTGRQYLRQMVKFFIDKGFKPLVLDTDGCNFTVPESAKELRYVSSGKHHFNKEGTEYEGVDAVVAEYNDKFMYGVMGLDIDEFCDSSINIARKNYANLMGSKVKLVGNTIKSKKLPIYIEEFIDVGLTSLLNGDGKSFVDLYYDTVDRIFNQQVPLYKIASKAKVKITKGAYIKKTKMKNKAGNPMPRQAHMELVIRDNIPVDLGDMIYYINTGLRKSHGDITSKKDKEGNVEVIFNCKVVPKEQIENDPGLTGDYNVARYLSNFNKRIKPLLVCFDEEVRDTLLVDDPKDFQYYTDKQLELISGKPYKEGDQDTLEELLTISEQENRFWDTVERNPDYMELDNVES